MTPAQSEVVVGHSHLDTLLAAQDGLIRQDQLVAAGVTRSALRWRLARGTWQTILPAIYAAFDAPPTPRQRLVAAHLYAGSGAQVTGAAVLRYLGVSAAPDEPHVRVLVPHPRQITSSSFVRVHRSRRLDPHPRVDGTLVMTSPARSVVEAARHIGSAAVVRAMVADVVDRQLATLEELAAELAVGPRQGSAMVRRALDTVVGAPSSARAVLTAVLAASAVLPPVLWRPRLFAPDGCALPSPDAWITEVDLGLDIDSDDWQRTVARHATLGRYGAQLLHIHPDRVTDDPEGIRREVERAYLDRLRAGVRGTIRAEPWPD
jgi:hypothetical protein